MHNGRNLGPGPVVLWVHYIQPAGAPLSVDVPASARLRSVCPTPRTAHTAWMSVDVTRCLVTGATGYVGGRLVPELLDRGYAVRALARNPDKLADVAWRDRVEVVRGDLGDAESLTEAFEGIDVVYYLVHSMGTSADFVAAEAESARNVVAAAKQRRGETGGVPGRAAPAGADLSPHLRSRVAVGDILLKSGIETVVLQAGIVVGAGSASFEMMRHLTNRLPAMTTPKWVHNKIQPISIDDVLHYLAEAAIADIPTSRTWDIGGPDALEYGEAMQVYAEVAACDGDSSSRFHF